MQLWFTSLQVPLRMMIVGEFLFLRNVIRRHSALPVSAERECLHHRTVATITCGRAALTTSQPRLIIDAVLRALV